MVPPDVTGATTCAEAVTDAEPGAAPPLAVLCGPTATGKTALAVPLAERLGAEIICADSRTIYRGMDIGTAKPTRQQRAAVPHHLLDVAEPRQTFTVADFVRASRDVIAAIRGRGRLALLAGGTGLYIRAVVDDFEIPAVSADAALRRRLETEATIHGRYHLHDQLAARDPIAAKRIHPANIRRVVRALEVVLVTGRSISEQQRRRPSVGPVAMVGLTMDRAALYRHIEARVEEQLAAGLVDEVRRLLAEGVPHDAPSMLGLGYKELGGWLRGLYDYDRAVSLLKRNTRRYAKRQWTWFRRDARVRWVDATSLAPGALLERVHAIMEAELPRGGRE